MTTWAQLGLHTKPIGLLNVAAYFDPLLALVRHATQEGFLHPFHAQILLCKDTPNELLESFATWATTRSALTVDSIPTGTSER
jgi:predicted Rossmann-fold nucleotide-binding protein